MTGSLSTTKLGLARKTAVRRTSAAGRPGRDGRSCHDTLRNGARGYFPLSTKPCVLEHALPLIMSGEFYIPACALRLGHGHEILAPEGLAPLMRSAGNGLTLRQCEVVVMLAEGKSNKEIAREFRVLEGTVKLHVKGILRKLGVRNRTEAVLAAARGGYLPKGTLGGAMAWTWLLSAL
jgi:two-component system nitrate/nitrite response regulator NarL